MRAPLPVGTLLLACLLASLVCCPAFAANTSPALPRTFDKLVNKKKLLIAYFGASIMAGAGASAPEKTSWRALTTKHLREQYPDATIEDVNTSIGGTGADFAAFRLGLDTLPKKPDLIFTDVYCNGPQGDLGIRCNEGIIRQIRQVLPEAEMVFTFVYTKSGLGVDQFYKKGEVPYADLHALTAHYAIPEIDLGKVLYDAFQNRPANAPPLLVDVCHPSDAGHECYAEAVGKFLKERIVKGDTAIQPMPQPYRPNPVEKPNVLGAAELIKLGKGWKVLAQPEGWSPPWWSGVSGLTTVESSTPAELNIQFTGSMIALYWFAAFDGGQLEWSVDGAPAQRIISAHDFAISKHNRYLVWQKLNTDLSYGPHTLSIRTLLDKPEKSAGTYIGIGAIVTE